MKENKEEDADWLESVYQSNIRYDAFRTMGSNKYFKDFNYYQSYLNAVGEEKHDNAAPDKQTTTSNWTPDKLSSSKSDDFKIGSSGFSSPRASETSLARPSQAPSGTYLYSMDYR